MSPVNVHEWTVHVNEPLKKPAVIFFSTLFYFSPNMYTISQDMVSVNSCQNSLVDSESNTLSTMHTNEKKKYVAGKRNRFVRGDMTKNCGRTFLGWAGGLSQLFFFFLIYIAPKGPKTFKKVMSIPCCLKKLRTLAVLVGSVLWLASVLRKRRSW